MLFSTRTVGRYYYISKTPKTLEKKKFLRQNFFFFYYYSHYHIMVTD